MSYSTINLVKKDKIATITLNRPEALNALNPQLRADFKAVLNEVTYDQDVKVVILTGAGRAFCAGGDIKSMTGITAPAGRDRLKDSGQITCLMNNVEKPIIAAVNGIAAGGGMHIAIAADIVIASENAQFRESFVNIGLIPDLGGFYNLTVRVGVSKAKELMMTGRPIDAKEAEAIGLVNKVVAQDMLIPESEKMARMIAEGPSRVYAMIKSALNLWPASFQTFMELEANMQGIAFASRDFDEGRKSFVEKRKAVFTGE